MSSQDHFHITPPAHPPLAPPQSPVYPMYPMMQMMQGFNDISGMQQTIQHQQKGK